MASWHEILNEYAERDRAAGPVHPTIHLGPHDYQAAIEAGFRPEDLTEMTAYVDAEFSRRLAEADRIKEPRGFLHWENEKVAEVAVAGGVSHAEAIDALNGMTNAGQELDMTRDGAGGSYVQISGNPGKTRYDGPAPWEPQQQNAMRPKHVNRTAVKAARKVARINRRKRGKH
jgi:hypothetical protein